MSTTLELSELNTKLGQLFMIGIPGPEMDERTKAFIKGYNLGGVVLFSRNIVDPLQLAGLCRDLQDTAVRCHNLPLFLAIDQEGGRVARLKDPFTQFPGNRAIGLDEDPQERAVEFARTTSREMTLVGLNMDLAPVVDVQRGETEKHLEGRTFGEDPQVVSELGKGVVRTLQENGIMAVAKHFPGLGPTKKDPHIHLPTIDIDRAELETFNLPPFEGAIEEGVSAIMTSHAVYPALDPDLPATLSPAVLTRLLREKMGFEGLIMTDDLEMGAIKSERTVADGAVSAYKAGADILLICENQDFFIEALEKMRSCFLQGVLPLHGLHQANARILKAKSEFLGQGQDISLEKVKTYFNLG